MIDEHFDGLEAVISIKQACVLLGARRGQLGALGRMPLQKVTPPAVNAFCAELLGGGRRDGGGGLAPKAVRNVHGVLHKALSDAVRWGRVVSQRGRTR